MQDISLPVPDDMEHLAGYRHLDKASEPIAAGIVTEYNPFHKGHAWQVKRLKEGGADFVVCVMSGPFVQRAEAAMLPTAVRARAALAGGVDLVLRLPVSWATASAEGFAQGAVGLLSALGCVDILAFGAECDHVGRLEEVARLLLSAEFPEVLKAELAKGSSFAAARSAAAERLLPGSGDVLRHPNNILGIEYIKALLGAVPNALRAAMSPDIQWQVISDLYGHTPQLEHLFPLPVPTALPRVGASHDGSPAGGCASASWLRDAARRQGVGAWAPWVPEACMPLYERAAKQGALLDGSRFETVLLSRLRGKSAAEFARHPGAGEGLEARLAEAAKQAVSLQQLYDTAKTKRFAHSRVRRLALSAALGLPARPAVIPPFAQVLAANGRGLALLKKIKQNAMIPVSTSLAKLAAGSSDAKAAVQLEAAAEDLHALCLQTPQPGGGAFTQAAAILAKSKPPPKPGPQN